MLLEKQKPNIICLTPVKNEAWILDRFLKCASLWADHIIIADQMSEDGSREIAQQYDKVILVNNPFPDFDERARQRILLETARTIPEPRLLITLDADEILSSNFLQSPEWNTVLQAKKGTIIYFQLANLLPDLTRYWLAGFFPWAVIDDGSDHQGAKIHGVRIPFQPNADRFCLKKIKVLHYQYTDWERMRSKHRWYQCWERLNCLDRSAIDIYRQYHHMDVIPDNEKHEIPDEWLAEYEQQGIDMTSVHSTRDYWWDKEVVSMLDKHGALTFKREDIWDFDWVEMSARVGCNTNPNKLNDPRSRFDKYVHRWLKRTQAAQHSFKVRQISKGLRLLDW